VERERELEILEQLLASARGGVGAALVVTRAPAIGTLSLLAAVRTVADDFRMVSARGGEFDRELPFGILRHLLEPVLARVDAQRAALLDGAAGLAEPCSVAQAPSATPSPPSRRCTACSS